MAEISWRTFVWGILLGMGLHVGWGLIELIIWVLASSVKAGPLLH